MFAAIRQRLRGWKTLIANGAMGVPAALYGLYLEFATVDFTPVIPTKYVAAFMVGWAILGVVLRVVTIGPIGWGQPAHSPKAGD